MIHDNERKPYQEEELWQGVIDLAVKDAIGFDPMLNTRAMAWLEDESIYTRRAFMFARKDQERVVFDMKRLVVEVANKIVYKGKRPKLNKHGKIRLVDASEEAVSAAEAFLDSARGRRYSLDVHLHHYRVIIGH